jgi:hypothetical protein
MNVFQNIAYSNSDSALKICNRYGYYQIQSEEELANCLQNIVAVKGESALKEIMELHPDKEVIIELFETKPEKQERQMETEKKKDCSCMANADGNTTTANQSGVSGIASQTNLLILVAAIIVSISIISMKK